jgi:hypothetical protein
MGSGVIKNIMEKTNTQQFIEDAIAGGFKRYRKEFYFENAPYGEMYLYKALLDPLAWQAVGKTRGWSTELIPAWEEPVADYEWQCKWHTFIDHLADGDDIDTALGKLQ